MSLFTRKSQDEVINLQEQLNAILKRVPILEVDPHTEPKIEALTSSREIRHLKKQIWKFYRR